MGVPPNQLRLSGSGATFQVLARLRPAGLAGLRAFHCAPSRGCARNAHLGMGCYHAYALAETLQAVVSRHCEGTSPEAIQLNYLSRCVVSLDCFAYGSQ
jgi:hypothetical protein